MRSTLIAAILATIGALKLGSSSLREQRPAQCSVTPPGLAAQPVAVLAGSAILSTVDPVYAGDISWIAPTKLLLGPLLSVGTIFFLLRVVLSWFPTYKLDEMPWSIVAAPTEPLLKATRQLIPPVAGVDISPIVWVSLLSFISEIMLGPQGLLTILAKKG